MKQLLYIHGFNSSPQSEKAQRCQKYFEARPIDLRVHIADFSPEPSSAIESLCRWIEAPENQCVGLIGSSLGGYYALYLHHRYKLPAVLVNPAVRPYELLQDYLGINKNLYTGEEYEVRQEHMDQLRALDVLSVVGGQGGQELYLLTQTGDEVLDYREATDALNSTKSWIVYGGDHAYQGFSSALPSIEHFFTNF